MSKRAEIRATITNYVKRYIKEYGVQHQPKELAKVYWYMRHDDEIARDAKAGVTFNDYEMWVKTAIRLPLSLL